MAEKELIDSLESRVHLSLASDMAGWINEARSDPSQACADVGVSLNEGLPSGTISATPKTPLLISARLTTAAQKQSDLILATDILSHSLNGTPAERAAREGYRAAVVIENAGVTISALVYTDPHGVLHRQHQAYIAHAGHRVQLFDERTSNIGIGTAIGTWGDSPAMASVIIFASQATAPAPRLFYRMGPVRAETVLE